jgi:hypothetical protein
MHLSVKIIFIRPSSIKRLQHLFDLFLEYFNQRWLILHSDITCLVQMIPFNRLPLPFSLKQIIEEARVWILRLEFLRLQINYLSQQVYIFTSLNHQSDHFLYGQEQRLLWVFVIICGIGPTLRPRNWRGRACDELFLSYTSSWGVWLWVGDCYDY